MADAILIKCSGFFLSRRIVNWCCTVFQALRDNFAGGFPPWSGWVAAGSCWAFTVGGPPTRLHQAFINSLIHSSIHSSIHQLILKLTRTFIHPLLSSFPVGGPPTYSSSTRHSLPIMCIHPFTCSIYSYKVSCTCSYVFNSGIKDRYVYLLTVFATLELRRLNFYLNRFQSFELYL